MTFAIENPLTIEGAIESIANKMIAIAGGHWTDGDASLTIAGTPKGRVIKYTNGAEVLYVCMVAARWGSNYSGGSSNDGYRVSQGIMVFFSDGWDSSNHIPSGNVQRMPFVFANVSGYNLAAPDALASDLYLWWEDNILTFLVRTGPSGNADNVSLFALERDADKEYDDSHGKFFAITTVLGPAGGNGTYTYAHVNTASYNAYFGSAPEGWSLPAAWAALRGRLSKYVHPFGCEYPASTDIRGSPTRNFVDGEDQTFNMCIVPMRATRSEATNRVYYAFPVVHGDSAMTWRSPIKTFKSFFPVEPNRGIIDGDIINVPVTFNGNTTPETWSYIYKALASPDGGQLDIAIKYDVPSP